MTPLLRQYQRIKSKYKDAILLFRLGDFYETFYEDAKIASQILGIALTQRQKGVPLAGIPHHAAQPYIARLVRAGYKVAICEQQEEPVPGKLVDREVVEVITKGTLLEPALLDDKSNNYLAAVKQEGKKFGLSLLELSTGEFKLTEVESEGLLNELTKAAPQELLVPASLQEEINVEIPITPRGDYEFTYEVARQELIDHFNVKSLRGFGCEEFKLGICAAGSILRYVKETKKREINHIRKITPYWPHDYMIIDEPTRRNLELIKKIGGTEGEGTLLWVIDATKTPMGARTLRNFLLAPLKDVDKINKRLNWVEEFKNSTDLLEEMRILLAEIPDIERLIARISLERANPRDLIALKRALEQFPKINNLLNNTLLYEEYNLEEFDDLIWLIEKAIVDNPPQNVTEGGIIKPGFSKEVDKLRKASMDGKKWIASLEQRERKRTGIGSLKVGFNNVFGYYIEVTKPNLKYVPADYIRKQTLVNAERFITQELKEYESKVLGADERLKKLEYEIFSRLRRKVAEWTSAIQVCADKLAKLDVFAGLAFCARRYGYTRPTVDDGNKIIIENGRHPVVELLLTEGDFVPNGTQFNSNEEVHIITGPNMAGKSTYLRQVALITIMAQMGSFVPADKAIIGVVDRIFTRIGASDDLARGVSTFLAEMNETANILNNAGARSLIVLDEIGRGTSTFDGLSIAWATVEYIIKHICAKTLFATHYHELTGLARVSPKVKNYSIGAKRYKDKIIFLRKVEPGPCDESYGVDVAKLAGLPRSVISRAREILRSLEIGERRRALERIQGSRQKNLFDTQVRSPILEEIDNLDINKLSPIEALLILKRLKELFEK